MTPLDEPQESLESLETQDEPQELLADAPPSQAPGRQQHTLNRPTWLTWPKPMPSLRSLGQRTRGYRLSLASLRGKRPHGTCTQRRFLRRRWWIAGVTSLLVTALLASQLNGDFGAWLADVSRAVLGPQRTAQIESWFLTVEDGIHQAQYHLLGQKGTAPWTPSVVTPGVVSPQKSHALQMMPLPVIAPLTHSALPGAGIWTTVGLPPPATGQPPFIAKTFLQPDAARPYAVVTLLQFDLRAVALHLVSGTTEPGGPLGHYGPGVTPVSDRQGNMLVAVFNGGYKYADGQYGLMTNGVVYVPPEPGVATLAITRQGQVFLGVWGQDPRLSLANPDLVAWRQNGALLIDHGQLNPLTNDGAAWGAVYLNRAYTWRSAIGLTDHGTLLYAAGDSLSAATLGKALQAAGAVMAMQTDINPKWVRAFTYQRSTTGLLQVAKLDPGMQGTGDEYFQSQGYSRDFFYVLRR